MLPTLFGFQSSRYFYDKIVVLLNIFAAMALVGLAPIFVTISFFVFVPKLERYPKMKEICRSAAG